MGKNFIDNLHELVIKHLTENNFGASNLASLLDISTSQTLRKVKSVTGKSVKIEFRIFSQLNDSIKNKYSLR